MNSTYFVFLTAFTTIAFPRRGKRSETTLLIGICSKSFLRFARNKHLRSTVLFRDDSFARLPECFSRNDVVRLLEIAPQIRVRVLCAHPKALGARPMHRLQMETVAKAPEFIIDCQYFLRCTS